MRALAVLLWAAVLGPAAAAAFVAKYSSEQSVREHFLPFSTTGRVDVLSVDPMLVLVHDFLSKDTCR